MKINGELHLHTCLSPDSQFCMSPSGIVKACVNRDVSLAAIADLNSSLNVPAFSIHAKKLGLPCLFGMEALTCEGARVLALFSDPVCAVEFGSAWYHHLEDSERPSSQIQAYLDEEGNLLGNVDKNLCSWSDVGIHEFAREVHRNDGLVIPCQVESGENSLLSQFGKIIQGDWDALEFLHPEHAYDFLDYECAVIPYSLPKYLDQIGEGCPLLDTTGYPLVGSNGLVNINTVRVAFERLKESGSSNSYYFPYKNAR